MLTDGFDYMAAPYTIVAALLVIIIIAVAGLFAAGVFKQSGPSAQQTTALNAQNHTQTSIQTTTVEQAAEAGFVASANGTSCGGFTINATAPNVSLRRSCVWAGGALNISIIGGDWNSSLTLSNAGGYSATFYGAPCATMYSGGNYSAGTYGLRYNASVTRQRPSCGNYTMASIVALKP